MTQAEFNKLKTEWIKTESWRVSGIDVDLRTYITMRGKRLTDDQFNTLVNGSNSKQLK